MESLRSQDEGCVVMPRILISASRMVGDIFTASSSHGAAANARAEIEARSARSLQAAFAIRRINHTSRRDTRHTSAAA